MALDATRTLDFPFSVRRRAAPPPARTADAAPGFLQAAFVVAGFVAYLGIHIGLNSPEPVEAGGSDPIYTLNQAVLIFGGAGLLLRHIKRCAPVLVPLSPFLMLLALALFSVLWSQAPQISFRRSLSLGTLLVFVLYVQGVFGTARVCRIQVGMTWAVAGASLVMAVAVPSSGYDIGDYARAIRGVFFQKNSLGEAMSTSMLALSFLVLRRRRLLWRDGAHTAMAVGMSVLAQSTTALLLCLMVAGATVLALMLARGGAVAGAALLAAVAGGTLLLGVVAVDRDLILNALGKDSTLTGRSAIWAGIGHAVGAWPALGYGYAAFWQPDSLPARAIWAEIAWPAPSAHSGYLDTVLELGVLGLGLVAAIAAWTVARTVWALRAGRWPEACWAGIVLLYTAAFNFDESSLPRPDVHQLQWMLALLALAGPAAARAMVTPRPRTAWLTGPARP